ncbi:MAG: PKD domain-containing protein [Euryarchaeota archaeon]|nr:PKD domain-containing protein [Euryarchaeota archaeon]MDE1835253.1 PKD domain-containing protein [Euryarchaeota archaeon]MDE1881085.1 PKD domain-containing protein [Euryarchaeota archaeon]MDE2043549.1 PKD domain-containing protein [Thermoplasmata archaeon]
MSYPPTPEPDPTALISEKCPSCGAPLPPVRPGGTATCPYCGTTYRAPAPAPPPGPIIAAAPALPSWYNPYAGGNVPSHAVYSAPVAPKRWPGVLVLVFVLLFFILPTVISMSSQQSYNSGGGGGYNSYLSISPSCTPVTTNSLQVSCSVVISGGSTPYSASWSFDDGGSAVGISVEYTFYSSGGHYATVTVTDNAGDTASQTTDFTLY